MSAFLTPLNVALLTCPNNRPLLNRSGRQLWRVITPFIYQSDVVQKTIIVPDGYVTDFASVPRAPVVYLALGEIANEPGVIHDYLYSTGPFPRETCDQVLKEACALIGLPAWKVWAIYAGVRVGGKSHYMRS